MSNSPLALKNISKNFGSLAALNDVSLEVLPGEVHALLGENGAGKSTLMNIASGTLQPDSGSIEIDGKPISTLTPHMATELGIAIVHQHSAVLPDLTIEENISISVPEKYLQTEGSPELTMRKILDDFGLKTSIKVRVENLTIAQQHLLDLAKAFVVNPKVLILDEPTAPLGKESVEILFDRIKKIAKSGTSVIYITHRLAEVRELANRVTILRDGKWRGVKEINSISDAEIMTLIVGRELKSTFPAKYKNQGNDVEFLKVEGISSSEFHDVSLSARKGEIIGISGVVGNGQSELLRALAGIDKFSGKIEINGTAYNSKELIKKSAYLPSDRHGEGLMMTMSVRENSAINALTKFSAGGFLIRRKELGVVQHSLTSLDVKAPSIEAEVSSLSGGNQQKIVMSRSLLSDPLIIIADEPTQGVDVGARAEIYKILRDVASQGIPVIVNSSDTKELEGLCDRVYVMSRGHVVSELDGSDVTEDKMVAAAISSTQLKSDKKSEVSNSKLRIRRLFGSDYLPPAVLVGMITVLALFIYSRNHGYFGSYNINAMLGLATGLGFIALGQTIVLMTGGIDLSVGPTAGVLLVVGSFFVNDKKSFFVITFGFILMFIVGILIGTINGSLIRFAKFTPVAGTLTIYIALIGIGFLLRPAPGGYINSSITDALMVKVGPIPVTFIILVTIAVILEIFLRHSKWGVELRASGSNEESARRLGVNINRTIIGAYIGSALFAALGAVIIMSIIGLGDPAQGTAYTLQSITAVVLGGTSLLGGRGSFFGSVLGSVLMIQVLNACTLLNLSQTWQYLFQGLLITLAAVTYTILRPGGKK